MAKDFFDVDASETEWTRLKAIFDQMDALGFFTSFASSPPPGSLDQPSILHHWDLEARNIIVRRKIEDVDDKWEISKIIDLSVAPMLARKPPIWLWDFSEDDQHASYPEDYDGDTDLLEPDHYGPGRLTENDAWIKRKFESRLVEGLSQRYSRMDYKAYGDEAYGKGRWDRRLARFALQGMSSSYDNDRLDALERAWSIARLSFA